MISLSAVIIAQNEEKQIVDCISCLSFADEIIVIDGGSTDHTIEYAKSAGAIVYKNKFIDFSKQRNFGLSKASGEWVLFIDADERVTHKLRDEIVNALDNTVNE